MDTPSYSLQQNRPADSPVKTTYKKSQLKDMTTFQLKEICIKEKIIKGIANSLDRNELINTIMRFRGEEENLLIREVAEGGFERMEEVLERKLGSRRKGEETIKNPAKLILYKGLDLTQYDDYQVRFSETSEESFWLSELEKQNRTLGIIAKELANTNVFLVNENNKLCSILNLISDGNDPEQYYLTKQANQEIITDKSRNYFLIFFLKQESDYLYQYYYKENEKQTILNYYKVPLAELEIRKVEETNAVLSIDFGTTNTAAGAFLNHNYIENLDQHNIGNTTIRLGEVNIVYFLDETQDRITWNPLLPTLISVSDCSYEDLVKYHYGYEALKDTKVKFHDESFSVFYEMKRWVENYTSDQEVADKAGNFAVVKRQEMIRNYILFVISNAEQRFKCRFRKLHLTSPVKLKEQFHKMFQEILPEYELNAAHMLDEGTAVIYNTISNLIEKKGYFDGERMSALIMDCGGGTTDLSSCEFIIQNQKASYRIDIETTFENGDTNFGGNNITYRIMQYLKIVFADYYGIKQTTRMEDLISETEIDIYRMVDKQGRDYVYEKLEQVYKEAEEFIPTKFRDYENQSREEYYLVKNNFYFLFQIAEQLKKKFYMKKGILRSSFHEEEIAQEDIVITKIDTWSLAIRNGNGLKLVHEYPNIVFRITDIELLIKGDIYWIVDRFLNEFYISRTLEKFSILKLTGQSCRIDLFREVIKEFLPGKCIEFKPFGNGEESIRDLKLACVKGAAKYVEDQVNGFCEICLHNTRPRIPYSISAYTHEQEERQLIYNLEQEKIYGTISRNKQISQLELFLRGGDGKLKFRYLYQNDKNNYIPKTYEEIRAIYHRYEEYLIQEETDTIGNNEVKFFVFAAKEQWGFYLIPITREGTQLYLGKEAFYPFENNAWEVNFFDGEK